MSNGKNRIQVILSAVDRGLTTGLAKARAHINGMMSALTGLVPQLLTLAAATGGLHKLVNVAREFGILNAGLLTATESAERADLAFSALEEFAENTPYDLQQVTDGFIKLVNYGLDPSERALTSYGNTSAALGKNLNQMIEAVADAAVLEFERLKEFGIKARNEGDVIRFTFRGVTTEVAANAAAIEEYLINLGEVNFGDAMANRMKEIDGLLSNFGDSWDGLFRSINNAGAGEIMADSIQLGIDAVEELTTMIDSGEIGAQLDIVAGQFSGWADDVDYTVDFVVSTFHGGLEMIGTDSEEVVDYMIDNFRRWPESVRAMVGIATVYVAASFDRMKLSVKTTMDTIKALVTDDTVVDVAERLKQQEQIIIQAKDAQIDAIIAEYEASVASADAQREAIGKLREEYEAQRAARREEYQGILAGSKIAGEAAEKTAAAIAKETREREKAAKAAAKLAAEKLRAASQEKIIALELENLEASRIPDLVARAEAELAIERRLVAERINLKRQQLDALKNLEGVDPAEIIRAESDLAELRLDVARTELDGQREIVRARLAAIEDSWRRSAEGIAEYRQAVTEAKELGLVEEDEYREKMIASSTSLMDGLRLGLDKAMEDLKTDAEIMMELGQQIPDRMATGLSDVFQGALQSAEDAKEAVADWARSTLSWIAQVILKQAILNAMQSAGFGLGDGGQVPAVKLAGGGPVPGWSPSPKADNIAAWLTAREFVQPVAAVDFYGLPFMESVRRKLFPRDLARALAGKTIPRIPSSYSLAQGGQVPGQPGATEVRSGDLYLRIMNVTDKNMMGDYLRGADGEIDVLNIIRLNSTTVKTFLGG